MSDFEGPAIVYVATDGTEHNLDRMQSGSYMGEREWVLALALMKHVIDRIENPRLVIPTIEGARFERDA